MAKQTVTIEVDVPEGWEFDRFDMPKAGEHWIDGAGMLHCAGFNYADTACVIVKKAWQWPAWLKAEWVAMDKDGEWWAYSNEPFCGKLPHWENVDGGENACVSQLFSFTPPPCPCTDWRQSKRRRPQ